LCLYICVCVWRLVVGINGCYTFIDNAFVEESRLLDSLKIYICKDWFVVEFMLLYKFLVYILLDQTYVFFGKIVILVPQLWSEGQVLSLNFQKDQYSPSTFIFRSNLSLCYIYCIITWHLCKKSSLPLYPSPSKFLNSLLLLKKYLGQCKQIIIVAWVSMHLAAEHHKC
jgi:hypothetical protein